MMATPVVRGIHWNNLHDYLHNPTLADDEPLRHHHGPDVHDLIVCSADHTSAELVHVSSTSPGRHIYGPADHTPTRQAR